jgi:hypothetical protein
MKSAKQHTRRSKHEWPAGQPPVPVIGLEAEFTLVVDGRPRRPETLFRSPQEFVRASMIPRSGKSYHLPSGGAVYFDTGVVEVATPIIEMEPGCCVRAVRSLWDQIRYLREELNVVEARTGKRMELAGFSAHYNFSFPAEFESETRTEAKLAWLLSHILPVPTMLLAANRRSTGIGVRPRDGRIEITADFTPDPDLMIAAVTAALGISCGVMAWSDYEMSQLERQGIPVIAPFKPRKHTSRKGWLARFDCYARSPFLADVNACDWTFCDGRTRSLRDAALEIATLFSSDIKPLGDADSFEHIFAVLGGRARSLLDFEDRPSAYDDVGRVFPWKRRSQRALPLSRYERVIARVISRRPLQVDGSRYLPTRMLGWYEIAFRCTLTGARRVFTLDDLAKHCGF